MKPSRKQNRILCLAANVAGQSDHSTHHIGAVLTKGGSVINTSCNKIQWNAFAARFIHLKQKPHQSKSPEHASIHAEIGSVLGIPRSQTNGADIYVVRVRKNGQYAMAKPCGMCQGLLSSVGIKRVFYTTDNNEIEKMLLRK